MGYDEKTGIGYDKVCNNCINYTCLEYCGDDRTEPSYAHLCDYKEDELYDFEPFKLAKNCKGFKLVFEPLEEEPNKYAEYLNNKEEK
jgi:hypothetical protein